MQLDYNKLELIRTIVDKDDQMLAAAVMYAEQGFYVLPIRPNDKAAPPKSTGLNYSSASNNPDTVRKWYSGKYKGWNIGLCCGAEDGIFVMDVDNKEDKDGFPAFREMEEDHGEFNTLTQITPSGGIHVVFTWFPNGRSSTSSIARGIDTRGGDGRNRSHIVAYPSSINGKMYEWSRGGKILEAPDWLADLMGVPWEQKESRGTGRGNENVDDEALEQQFTPRECWNMLEHINPDGLEYDEWLKIGQALHSQHPDDTGLKLWDKWSQKGERYERGECEKRWDGFKSYGPVRVGTLIYFAKAGGYAPKPNVSELEFGDEKSEYEELIAEMNEEWGIAVVGGKIRVVGASLNSDPDQDLQLLTLDDFKNLTMNKKIAMTTGNGQVKAVPKSAIWLADEKRKEYRGGIHFRPDRKPEYQSPAGMVYNMWRGWTMEPKKGDWSKLRTHIKDILCCGNELHYDWVLDWMADLYQDPANPKGCAVVMHGVEGCGKGTFMEAMGRTMGRHYKHVTQEDHLTGRFNGHLQDALLVFADEVTYGGSRKTAGNLKAMVTESKLTVERKGIDAVSFRNCSRIGIASNEDWFIPAGPQSRRWFVLDVSSEKAQKASWFRPIYHEMDNGGVQAMMYDLLEREITSDLSTAPVTEALLDQRARFADSRMDSMQMWWYDALESAYIEIVCYLAEGMEDGIWPQLVGKPELYENYKAWVKNSGLSGVNPMSKSLFYSRLSSFGFVEVRPSAPDVLKKTGGKRTRMYEVPPHDEACKIFTKTTGKEI
jgi:hypothetical protein